jgi:hypothetical protein
MMKLRKPKIRKPISLRAGKREVPKTVYNRKHEKREIPWEFIRWRP